MFSSITFGLPNSLPSIRPPTPTPQPTMEDTVSGWVQQNPQPVATDPNTIQQGVNQSQQNISNLSGQASAYPAYPNAYGLGAPAQAQAQNPAPTSASAPGYQSQALTNTAPDTASRGFNPWSLLGEANARGRE